MKMEIPEITTPKVFLNLGCCMKARAFWKFLPRELFFLTLVVLLVFADFFWFRATVQVCLGYPIKSRIAVPLKRLGALGILNTIR